MSTALETTGLGKRYGRTWALRDCSLRLPAGRIGALVGPNGAGKTTLLHLIVGLLRPDAGSVHVLGRTPTSDKGLLTRVGFVAQDAPMYPHFTVPDLLTMGQKLNQRWDSGLASGRLERARVPFDRKVGKLSGGQRAQVALALALAKRPELLILDEPVASLDPLARREFLQALMGAVADDGTTVLLSSHLVADLERVCDYLIVLQESRVQVIGAVDDLLAEHKLLIGPRRTPSSAGDSWTATSPSGTAPAGATPASTAPAGATPSGTAPAGVAAVVRDSHTDKQSTRLVRTNGPILDPAWTSRDLSLEDLVLAYLAEPSAGVLPGPMPLGSDLSS